MAIELQADADLLRFAAAKLERDGYTVLLEPSGSLLPVEFKDLRPDGIALGKEPRLLIEIAHGEPGSSERVRRLQDAVRGKKDWGLHLVFGAHTPEGHITTLALKDISDSIRRIEAVAREDSRAALLMCWASLEALARALQPKTFSRAQTPGRITELLAGVAYVPASDAEFLRKMAAKRNELAHGQLLTLVNSAEIARFLEVLESLVSESSAEGVH